MNPNWKGKNNTVDARQGGFMCHRPLGLKESDKTQWLNNNNMYRILKTPPKNLLELINELNTRLILRNL